jgi:hypothetical protein
MLVLKKTEHCVGMKIFQQERKNKSFGNDHSSYNFYITKDEFNQLIFRGYVYSKDIGYATLSTQDDILNVTIDWLDYGSNGDIRGFQDKISVPIGNVIEWYMSNEEQLKILEYQEIKNSIFKVYCPERVNQVVSENRLKRKFIKQMEHLQRMNFDSINLMSDFVDYSFYWEGFNNGKRTMNGGIIFHKDHSNPEDLNKGKYSMHT